MEKYYIWNKNAIPIYFEHRTPDENKVIQDVANIYYFTNEYKQKQSVDNTHSEHSTTHTKNRNRARDNKWSEHSF